MPASIKKIISLAALCAASSNVVAQEKVLNLYSSRHYQTDEALYSNFTRQTGIRINRIEAPEDALIERLRNEGAASPADVLVTVDAGRLWRAEQLSLFQPVRSAMLDSRVPENLRHPDGLWFGFSTRARVIVYNKDAVKPGEIRSYEDLADPKWKGKVCMRSSSNMYNLSLAAALVSHAGEQKTEEWARGVVANFARDPKGGDTDQIKAVFAGQCDVALSNSYYYVRIVNSDKAEDKAIVAKTQVVFPNQGNRGTHVNVSGGGLVKNAPNKDAAIKFLEYLASDSAQIYFANGNNEWPVTEVPIDNKGLASLGNFKRDAVNVAELGRNQAKAQAIMDKVGWK